MSHRACSPPSVSAGAARLFSFFRVPSLFPVRSWAGGHPPPLPPLPVLLSPASPSSRPSSFYSPRCLACISHHGLPLVRPPSSSPRLFCLPTRSPACFSCFFLFFFAEPAAAAASAAAAGGSPSAVPPPPSGDLSLAALSLRVPIPAAGGPAALRAAALAALSPHGSPVRWAIVGVEPGGVALVDAVVSVP